ncbi:hypothetical protein BCR39DRAFT_575262 [Naematelia encephala]|uniref:trimethyllysine dioxygenase n=1 Tax=Naematelia encephala TaxID=71784 RepID=A0A1Y2B508_9TREE|nr:hypothetical protein BCR39DRAFT_575262 [Naematelia encephala]
MLKRQLLRLESQPFRAVRPARHVIHHPPPCIQSRNVSYVQVKPVGLRTAIAWPNGVETTFDNQFLLDHCRCPKCFHPVTKQRLKSLFDFTPLVEPDAVEVDTKSVRIVWSDAHESRFPFSFLLRAAYDPPLAPREDEPDDRILWNSRISQSPPIVQYQSLMIEEVGEEKAELGILRWLRKVSDFGFCLVSDVPVSPQETQKVIERIATIRPTHYGGFWDFTANMSLGDLAYSSQALPAHTDTTYFTDPAGLQIFHLLSHPSPPGTGGSTLLVDAFYSASLLSQLDPTAYSVLSRLRVPAHASGTPGSLLRPVISQPTFRHDERGRLAQVRWNNEDRGVIGSRWTPGDVQSWYAAARRFEEICRNEDTEYWVQLRPGTLLVIDNWRVMHGRSAFTGDRRMCGAYIGADDWRSRKAALEARFVSKAAGEDDIWESGW